MGRVVLIIIVGVVAVFAGVIYSNGMTKKRQTVLYSFLYVCLAASVVMYFQELLRGTLLETFDEVTLHLALLPAILIALSALSVLFVCLVMRTDKPDKARKILFRTAIGVVGLINFWLVIETAFGIAQGRETYFPAHICRQLAFIILPLVYLAPKTELRRYVLAFTCYASMAGGILTLVSPLNGIMPWYLEYYSLDSIIIHATLIIVPVMIFASREITPEYVDIAFGIPMYAIMILFAFLCNAVAYWETGTFGDYAYITIRKISFLPIWLFICLQYLCAVAIGFAIKFIFRQKYERTGQ